MSVESMLDAFGLGEMLARDLLAVQLIILAATAAVFALSLAIMLLAARSAGRARKARLEAESILRNAQDFVVEARQISAQIDRAMARAKAGGAEGSAPIRVGARQSTPEAQVDIIDKSRSDAVSNRNLDAARESATVPSGLLGRRRRG